MNDVVAQNIRTCREKKAWTQEHLAAAAALSARTVQRAENGLGMTAETLTAIAGALDVRVDDLRFDPEAALAVLLGVKREELTPEIVAEGVKRLQQEFEAKHKMVAMARVTSASDFVLLEGTHAMQFAVLEESETVQDLAVEFQQHISDYSDIARDLEPIERHESRKEALRLVRELEALGCAVSIGTSDDKMVWGGGKPMDARLVHVVVTPIAEVKPFIAIPLNSIRI